MNTTASEVQPDNKKPFLTPKEEEDFKIWTESKIRSGSKPYEIDGNSFENSSNSSSIQTKP